METVSRYIRIGNNDYMSLRKDNENYDQNVNRTVDNIKPITGAISINDESKYEDIVVDNDK